MAGKGILVVLADVLGAPPDSVNSNMAKKGEAAALWKGTHYWPAHRCVCSNGNACARSVTDADTH